MPGAHKKKAANCKMAAFFIFVLLHCINPYSFMSFINPYFLFAFLTLSVPVLIHLFNLRRYKKEYFTNVKFLSQIQQETRKQSQLKQLLLLLARMLTVASLVMAFSQPYLRSAFQKEKSSSRHTVSIYIDNSFSMENNGPGGRLLESARHKAVEIVTAYKSSDAFQLMTNDLEGRGSRSCGWTG